MCLFFLSKYNTKIFFLAANAFVIEIWLGWVVIIHNLSTMMSIKLQSEFEQLVVSFENVNRSSNIKGWKIELILQHFKALGEVA